MTDEHKELLTHWPGLAQSPWQKTGEATDRYNCIAHAADDSSRWWWPGGSPTPGPGDDYWPVPGASDERTEDFVGAFEALGYARCPGGALEPGVDKVAFYFDASGLVQHAARQLPDGRWSSKLGQLADIAHDLEGLEGAEYGQVALFLGRPRMPR